jgi:ribosomal protein S18 acetylase RimI-like enzyme
MQIEFLDDAARFATRCWPLLAADEVLNTAVLARLHAVGHQGDSGASPAAPLPVNGAGESWHGAVVCAGERAVAVACHARGHWLLSTGPAAAFRALGATLRGAGFDGVAGPADSVRAFADGCGEPFRLHFTLPLMQLAGPACPGQAVAGGTMTPATPADRALVTAWYQAFHREARLPDAPERIPGLAAEGIAAGTIRLWRDAAGTPWSLACGRLIPPGSARIGPVYTPPPARGRGHAQALVARLADHLQAQGAATVVLFTDAANPTSNALYRRIGFKPAGLHLHLIRVPGPPAARA